VIRPAVLDAWHAFSEPLEGRVHSMYLDVLGLVTTGVGNLIDTPEQAAALPWLHERTGAPATRDEVIAAWRALKARKDLAKMHWKYAAALNDLRLSDDAIDQLVALKLRSNAVHLQLYYFRDFAEWPADAQLAALSMAWALGPGFPKTFKNFTAAVVAAGPARWIDAKACCKIRTEGNPGVVPRNRANERCLDNAHTVHAHGLDPAELHWPAQLLAPVTVTP
jgi:hypothetical protein